MQTEVISVNTNNPETAVLQKAASILQSGGLVAFPTETVYGLGANALSESAVRKIFAAKGRPANNPLIVHVHNKSAAKEHAENWPEIAETLANQFWPGSLTLVLRKKDTIPSVVTAGGPTVALRVPGHPVALRLLEIAQLPVAAPSANRSNRLSPTTAEHVRKDLNGRVDLIVDAGPAPGGLESTVLDVTVRPPRLLRPGLVTAQEIESVIGCLDCSGQEQDAIDSPRSPGLIGKHYAPRAPLELVEGSALQRVQQLLDEGRHIGWVALDHNQNPKHSLLVKTDLPCDAKSYSSTLYATLHDLDAAGVERIIVDAPPNTGEWLAVLDRLWRAAE